ncbi:hypothetical protein C3L33_22701, partial [Rhododendron williamsianum]
MASTMLSLSSASAIASSSLAPQHNRPLGGSDHAAVWGKNKSNSFMKTKVLRVLSRGRITMAIAVNVSRFEGITMAPPDPILGVSEAFRADTHEMKLNLGVGAYRTEELQPYVLNVVKKAENLMLERGENKEYLPIEGLAAFNKVTAELLFGADNPVIEQKRVATVQGLSGTGSLRLAAALIERYFPGAKVIISSPTWGNHKNIFNDARVPWSEYRYYDPKTVGLDFDGMISDIKAAPEGSFVLLHGCAHNPTGIDPTPEQWATIADVIEEKNHIPFFDVAYQSMMSSCVHRLSGRLVHSALASLDGEHVESIMTFSKVPKSGRVLRFSEPQGDSPTGFRAGTADLEPGFASGSLDEDASSVRLFAARGMELLVAQSYSKNLGLYAERIGAINVLCSSADAATRYGPLMTGTPWTSCGL